MFTHTHSPHIGADTHSSQYGNQRLGWRDHCQAPMPYTTTRFTLRCSREPPLLPSSLAGPYSREAGLVYRPAKGCDVAQHPLGLQPRSRAAEGRVRNDSRSLGGATSQQRKPKRVTGEWRPPRRPWPWPGNMGSRALWGQELQYHTIPVSTLRNQYTSISKTKYTPRRTCTYTYTRVITLCLRAS